MKTLSCKDISPATDCNFVAEADTAEATVEIMMEHAMKDHSTDVAEMAKTMSKDEMMKMMLSKVKDM